MICDPYLIYNRSLFTVSCLVLESARWCFYENSIVQPVIKLLEMHVGGFFSPTETWTEKQSKPETKLMQRPRPIGWNFAPVAYLAALKATRSRRRRNKAGKIKARASQTYYTFASKRQSGNALLLRACSVLVCGADAGPRLRPS